VGLTYVRIRVSKKASTPTRTVRVLVDTGATYTMLPSTLLRGLGIVPSETERVRLGDGRLVEWGLGQAYVRYGRYETPTWILFGENRSLSVLGALTLEELRLHVDPRSRRLRKTKIAVMAHAALVARSTRPSLAL
jgi:predicted aspartyl protease